MLQVLEGYVYLGNTATLGEEAMNAFANVVSTAAHRVIRGVILTRQGLEGKARSTSMVQELVKLLPPDLFRTCLARVSVLLTCPKARSMTFSSGCRAVSVYKQTNNKFLL